MILITFNIYSQEDKVNKFRSDRYAVGLKIDGEWESFSNWEQMEKSVLIVFNGTEDIKYYTSSNDPLTYDIIEYSIEPEDMSIPENLRDQVIKYVTIDDKGKKCIILLTDEKDETGNSWNNLYFYYDDIKLVYNLY